MSALNFWRIQSAPLRPISSIEDDVRPVSPQAPGVKRFVARLNRVNLALLNAVL